MSEIVHSIDDAPPHRDSDNDLSDVVKWLGYLNAMQLDRVVDYQHQPGDLKTLLVSLFFVSPNQAPGGIELLLVQEGTRIGDPRPIAGVYTRRSDDSFGYVSFTSGRVAFDSFKNCHTQFDKCLCGREDNDIANNFALKSGVELLLVRAKKLADKPEFNEKMRAVRSAIASVAPHLCQ